MRTRLAAFLRRSWALRTSRWFRYSLPFVSTFCALIAQFSVALLVGTKSNFPFAFFYLLAAFVTAWVGGFIPGVVSCVLIIVGLPLAASHDFETFDWSRLLVFVGVSLLVSAVARAQRLMRQKLQIANEELDQRVASRTKELAHVVDSLRSEIEQHKRTTHALIESEQRVDFTLESAGIGRWDLDLATRRMSRSPLTMRFSATTNRPPNGPAKHSWIIFGPRIGPLLKKAFIKRSLMVGLSSWTRGLCAATERSDGSGFKAKCCSMAWAVR